MNANNIGRKKLASAMLSGSFMNWWNDDAQKLKTLSTFVIFWKELIINKLNQPSELLQRAKGKVSDDTEYFNLVKIFPRIPSSVIRIPIFLYG